MARPRPYVFMDTNSLVRLVYAVATARHRNEATPLRSLVEARLIEIIVTRYIVDEAKRRLEKLVTKKSLEGHGWSLGREEIIQRLHRELDNMMATDQVTVIDEPGTRYTAILYAVRNRPTRRVMLTHRDWLLTCVRSEACRKNIGKDLPVVEGILLAYDVAAAVPAASRPGVSTPSFVVVTSDKDLFCSLYKCLRRRKLDKRILLTRFDVFKSVMVMWVEELLEDLIADKEMYRWCLTRHCSNI